MTFLTLESFIYFDGTGFLDFIVMIFIVNSETLNTQKAHLALFQNVGWYRLNRDEKKFTYIRGNIYIGKVPSVYASCSLIYHTYIFCIFGVVYRI